MLENEPLRVKVFVCHNALQSELGRAGLDCLELPELVHVEQVPCLGRVDPRYILKDFEAGCDAVCLIGCPIGTCRTMDGNLRAERRAAYVRGILSEIGVEGDRVFVFLREAMDEKAAREVVEELMRAVRAMGPSGLEGNKRVRTS